MAVYVTKEGRENLLDELNRLYEELKNLTEEKNYAYNNCGDTWHDNPTFNELEQRETRMMLRVSEKQKMLKEVVVIEISNRNLESVSIGSIVKFEKNITKKQLTNIEMWEIVGHSESNPQNKKLAYDTPLGKILSNMKKDEIKEINDPVNGITKYKIINFFSSWDEVK